MLASVWPAAASADPVPTITLDRDGPVTLLVQSKSAFNILGIAVTSPTIAPVCADCRGGETAQLGPYSRGTEIVLRLEDGQKTFLSSDPLHAEKQKLETVRQELSSALERASKALKAPSNGGTTK